ncbi:MAG: rhodanese-like domain-containing protein [Cellvibrionaceae bacterium]
MIQLKTIFAALLLSLAALAASAVAAEEAVWIDVRTQAEYEAAHLEGTTLIPHTTIGDQIDKLGLDKSAPIKLFCRSGGRAGMAKETLESMGYTNVENVGSIGEAREVKEAKTNSGS